MGRLGGDAAGEGVDRGCETPRYRLQSSDIPGKLEEPALVLAADDPEAAVVALVQLQRVEMRSAAYVERRPAVLPPDPGQAAGSDDVQHPERRVPAERGGGRTFRPTGTRNPPRG